MARHIAQIFLRTLTERHVPEDCWKVIPSLFGATEPVMPLLAPARIPSTEAFIPTWPAVEGWRPWPLQLEAARLEA